MVTYPIYRVDECLSVARFEGVDHIGRIPVREDCLDERGELVLVNCAADQLLPCLLVGVDSDGWIGEAVRMLRTIMTRRGGINIHEHKVRRAFDKSEVVIGGQDPWWWTVLVGLYVERRGPGGDHGIRWRGEVEEKTESSWTRGFHVIPRALAKLGLIGTVSPQLPESKCHRTIACTRTPGFVPLSVVGARV